MLNVNEEIKIPDNVTIEVVNKIIRVKGAKGELERNFYFPGLSIKKEGNILKLHAKNVNNRVNTVAKTFKAHINNLIKGVDKGFTYKMKICSGHFPMSVSIENSKLVIKNFLGEKAPRMANILDGVDVKVEGDEISVYGINKEKVGQTMANIEQATKVKGRDRRIFMDGIWLYSKEK